VRLRERGGQGDVAQRLEAAVGRDDDRDERIARLERLGVGGRAAQLEQPAAGARLVIRDRAQHLGDPLELLIHACAVERVFHGRIVREDVGRRPEPLDLRRVSGLRRILHRGDGLVQT
jgi:hypothetical protein